MTRSSPLFLDDALLAALLRATLGSSIALVNYHVALHRDDYAVVIVTLASPAQDVVVKLAGPRAPIACPFDRTATIVDLVRSQTPVPTFDVLAADVSYRDWPWRYMVTTHLPGTVWAEVSAQLMADSHHQAYRDLGQAVAHLHRIAFPAFGEIDADGDVRADAPLLEALERRAERRVADPRHVALFASVLRDRASLFDHAPEPALCHEDLNPSNILLHQEGSSWHIAAILDFDSAWAGDPESDLARLDLWRGMVGEGFRAAYEAIRPIAPGYTERRPVYQLLWCLEYASSSPQHLADTAGVCAELGIPPIAFS
jgi:aminoglycoside phosphotransferase (APT) family kinase protein